MRRQHYPFRPRFFRRFRDQLRWIGKAPLLSLHHLLKLSNPIKSSTTLPLQLVPGHEPRSARCPFYQVVSVSVPEAIKDESFVVLQSHHLLGISPWAPNLSGIQARE